MPPAEKKEATSPTASSHSVTAMLTSPPSTPPLPLETVIIFDWDDTLLANSFLSSKGHRLDNNLERSPELEAQLKELEASVIGVLNLALGFGVVHIVTNAETGWVQMSAEKFIPGVVPLLSKVQVVSARSTYEAQHPDAPLKWKYYAFHEKLSGVLATDKTEKNVISFGDSYVEREAVRAVTLGWPYTRTKSVKFAERPSMEQLRRQIELVSNCFHYIYHHRDNLDLQLTVTVSSQPSSPTASPAASPAAAVAATALPQHAAAAAAAVGQATSAPMAIVPQQSHAVPIPVAVPSANNLNAGSAMAAVTSSTASPLSARRLTPPTTPTHTPMQSQSMPLPVPQPLLHAGAPSTPKLGAQAVASGAGAVPKSPAHPSLVSYPSSVPTTSLVPNSPRVPPVIPNSPRTATQAVQNLLFAPAHASAAHAHAATSGAAALKPSPIMLPPAPLSPPALKLGHAHQHHGLPHPQVQAHHPVLPPYHAHAQHHHAMAAHAHAHGHLFPSAAALHHNHMMQLTGGANGVGAMAGGMGMPMGMVGITHNPAVR